MIDGAWATTGLICLTIRAACARGQELNSADHDCVGEDMGRLFRYIFFGEDIIVSRAYIMICTESTATQRDLYQAGGEKV